MPRFVVLTVLILTATQVEAGTSVLQSVPLPSKDQVRASIESRGRGRRLVMLDGAISSDMRSRPATTSSVMQGGDTYASATVITSLPFNAAGTTIGFNYDYDASCGVSDGAPDVVYSYTAEATGEYLISLCSEVTDFDTRMWVVRDDGGGMYTEIDCNDDGCNLLSKVYVSIVAGSTYYIVISASCEADQGSYELSIESLADLIEGVDCLLPFAIEFDPLDGELDDSQDYAIDVSGGGPNSTIGAPNCLFWQFTAEAAGLFTFSLEYDGTVPIGYLNGLGGAIVCGVGAYGLDYGASYGPFVLQGVMMPGWTYILETFDWGEGQTGTLSVSRSDIDHYSNFCWNADDLGTGDGSHYINNWGATLSESFDYSYCEPGGYASCGDKWYKWESDQSGYVSFDMCMNGSSNFNSRLYVYRGYGCTGSEVIDAFGCSDNGCGGSYGGGLVELTCTAGEQFTIRIASSHPPTACKPPCRADFYGSGYLDIRQHSQSIRPPNDNCPDVVPVVLDEGNAYQYTSTGTTELASWGSCPTTEHESSVWEAFHIDQCMDVEVNFCNSPPGDGRFDYPDQPDYIFTGCPCEGPLVRINATEGGFRDCPPGEPNRYWEYLSLAPGSYHVIVNKLYMSYLPNSTIMEYTININASPVECATLISLQLQNEQSQSRIVVHQPIFYWVAGSSGGSDCTQTGYEIEVGTDNDWSVAEMWQPGQIAGEESSTTYAGAPLLDGVTYFARLRVGSTAEWTPWYETSFHMNSLPIKPDLLTPANGASAGYQPTLYALNSTDAEGDPLQYEFEISTEPEMTTIIETSGLIPEETDSTGWTMTSILSENQTYFWRCRAYDGYEYGEWSLPWFFYVNYNPEAPGKPALVAPVGEDLILYEMLPTFEWTEATDPDPFDYVHYRLEVALDPDFAYVNTFDDLTELSYQMTDSLAFGEHYWWRVLAIDNTDLATVSDTADFWTWSGTCCIGRVGDANGEGGDEPTIGDVSVMIDAKFITGTCDGILGCLDEADINQSGGVGAICDDITIGDISALIDYLFITGSSIGLADCL